MSATSAMSTSARSDSDMSDASDMSDMSDVYTPASAPLAPEAFATDDPGPKLIRQIAAATETPLQEVQEKFAELFQETAFDSSHVRRYAASIGASSYEYHGSRLVDVAVPPTRNPHNLTIVFATWGGRAYLYKGMGHRARDDAQRFSKCPSRVRPRVLCKSLRHVPRPVEEFKPFPVHLDLAEVQAGNYWAASMPREDEGPEYTLEGILERFLLSRRYPRVSKARYPMLGGHVDRAYEIQ